MAVQLPPEMAENELMARSVMDAPRNPLQKLRDLFLGRTLGEQAVTSLTGVVGARGTPFKSLRTKAIGPGAYAKLPDTLMGLSERNPKGFADQMYRFELPVQVQIPGQEPFEDAVKGLNFQHAMARALRNWPGASIVPLGRP